MVVLVNSEYSYFEQHINFVNIKNTALILLVVIFINQIFVVLN